MGLGQPFIPAPSGATRAALPSTLSKAPMLSGHGSPEGTVPGVPGQPYTDLDTNCLWLKMRGDQKLGWRLIACHATTTTTTTPPPPPTITDMPLDQAVHHPTLDVIFGVRGGFVQEFNATTGVPTSNRARIAVPTFGQNSVAYDSISDRLYAILWSDPDGGATKGIQVINPGTLAVESFIDLTALGFSPNSDGNIARLICRSGILFGITSIVSNGVFRYEIVGAAFAATYPTAGDWQEVELNGAELWTTDSVFGQAAVYDNTTLNFITSIFSPGVETWGICVNPTNGRGYFTTRTAAIKRVDQDHSVLADLILPDASAKPFCIRYNAADNKIYCADETTNTVFVIDATTEAVASQTGFDSPFDVVFTPTKKFAVQHGLDGLKEIV